MALDPGDDASVLGRFVGKDGFGVHAASQYRTLIRVLDAAPGLLPRSHRHGSLDLVPPDDWTSGFFPGCLWLLHELTGEIDLADAARRFTDRLRDVPRMKHTHDLGFMVECSFGNAWRLRRDTADAAAMVEAAHSLAGRFDPRVGLIRSWDFGDWRYPVIIDNMMNLGLLFEAAELSGNGALREVARRHADRTMETHFRPDGSCVHLADFDPETGNLLARQTVQGHSDTSAWSRGQAWAIHGFSAMYRWTGDDRYRLRAERTAAFWLEHPRLPDDGVPYWDFDDPAIPHAQRDSSAAAVAASAFVHLAGNGAGSSARVWIRCAERILRSLLSPSYLAAVGENGGFLLRHGVGFLPVDKEIDVPLAYGDYYLLEALVRLRRIRAAVTSGLR